MTDPVLTWFDCSGCALSVHIAAEHRDAVEAHHLAMAHDGDESATLEERA